MDNRVRQPVNPRQCHPSGCALGRTDRIVRPPLNLRTSRQAVRSARSSQRTGSELLASPGTENRSSGPKLAPGSLQRTGAELLASPGTENRSSDPQAPGKQKLWPQAGPPAVAEDGGRASGLLRHLTEDRTPSPAAEALTPSGSLMLDTQ